MFLRRLNNSWLALAIFFHQYAYVRSIPRTSVLVLTGFLKVFLNWLLVAIRFHFSMTQGSINDALAVLRRPNFLSTHMDPLLLSRFRRVAFWCEVFQVDPNSFHGLGNSWWPDYLLRLINCRDTGSAHILLRGQVVFASWTLKFLAERDAHEHRTRDLKNFLFC